MRTENPPLPPSCGRWRLLNDGAGPAAWNMALDEALLDVASANRALSTLRLYQWERVAISIGRFQSVARTLHGEVYRSLAIPLVRRVTGGRGVLHGDDLTVSIVASEEALGLNGNRPLSPIAIYERLASGFLSALQTMGVAATSGMCPSERAREVRGDCFATVSRADLIASQSGRKLLGAAIHRRDRWVLQQVSIPLCSPVRGAEMAHLAQSVFRGPSSAGATSGAFALDVTALRAALVHGMASALGIEMQLGVLTMEERQRTETLVQLRYASADWTRER